MIETGIIRAITASSSAICKDSDTTITTISTVTETVFGKAARDVFSSNEETGSTAISKPITDDSNETVKGF